MPFLGVAALSFLLFYLTVGLQGPVMAGLLHDRVQARMRSTMMSVEGVAVQAGAVLASLVVGALAATLGLAAGFGVVALASLAAATVLLIDLQRAAPPTDGM